MSHSPNDPSRRADGIAKNVARAVVILIGALYAWRYRFIMNPDGVAYLGVADRIARDGWYAAIHTHRSPLFPLFLAAGRMLVHPTPYSEASVAHGVTFALYCAAFAGFEFLLAQIADAVRRPMPLALKLAAYALFLWCCNFADQTGPRLLTPDLIVAAIVFAASALVLRIARTSQTWPVYAALGCILGIGYLGKEAMLPIGALLLAAAMIAGGRRGFPRVAVAAALFVSIAMPYVVPLSLKLGRLSTGETSRYNWILWIASRGEPLHKTAILNDSPRVEAYPPGIDTSGYAPRDDLRFWLAGQHPRLDVHAQIHAVLRSIAQYSAILAQPLFIALGTAAIALLMLRRARPSLLHLAPLIVPSLAALAMYGLVLVQPRYVGPSMIVVGVGLLAAAWVESPDEAPRVVTAALIAVAIVVATSGDTRTELQRLRQPAVHEHWLVAQLLASRGVRRGEPVAILGDPYMCYWSRLAQTPVRAEVSQAFWNADAASQERALAALHHAGIRAVVAVDAPPGARGCWEHAADTPYAACVR